MKLREKKAQEEVRKVQRTGRASFLVSLPKRWVKKVGIEQGDQIEMQLQKESLVLTPRISRREEKPEEFSMSVDKDDNPQTLKEDCILVSSWL